MSALGRTGVELRRAARGARASWGLRATLACAALAAAAIVPPATGLLGNLGQLAGHLYLAVAAVGLGFAVGVAGVPSLAQGAFVGIGAFASVLARLHLGLPLAPAAVLGALAAGAAGLLAGVATVRLRPALIAVATWLLSWLALLALQAFPSVFGGSEGLAVAPALSAAGHYALALVLLALAALAFVTLTRAPVGMRIAAARDRPAAAAAAGVPVARLRVRACGLAALLAGLAGALNVDVTGVADPAAYGPDLSLELLVAVLIGGAASALGGPAGIALLALVAAAGRSAAGFSDQLAACFQTMIAALVVLLLLPEDPRGLLPALERHLLRVTRRDGAAPPPSRDGAAPLPPREGAAPLRARGLAKRYGDTVVLAGLDLDVEPGHVHALVGLNGSGKTTALRALADTLRLDGGRVELGGADITAAPVARRVELGIVRALQATAVFGELSALENVVVGVATRARHSGMARSIAATPRQRAEALALRATAREALVAVGLGPRADQPADELSATEQRLLMIAIVLGTDPRVVLLDEPSSGVGAAELPRLADAVLGLRDRGVGVLVVEHNLRFVATVADRVTVLDAGRAIAVGAPAEIARDPAVRTAYLGRFTLSGEVSSPR